MERKISDLLTRVRGGRWLLLAILFSLIAIADYAWFGFTRIVDQRAGDILLASNARQRDVSDRIVIIDIDQRSLELMNDMAGSWPWPRSVHGELIDHIEKQSPRAIAFDIMFNELDVYRPEHDAAFADAVARNSNVWLAMTLNSDGQGAWVSEMPKAVGARPAAPGSKDARVPLMLPLVMAQHPEAMRGGLINFTPDTDTVGRHYMLYGQQNGWRFPSLPARVIESLKQPLPDQASIMLNWRSGWKHVSYADIYLDGLRQHPQRPQDEFQGKMLIIGTSAPGLMDLRLTPLDSTYPGVEILATAFDNLDRGDWLNEIRRTVMLPLALALIFLSAFSFARGQAAQHFGYFMIGLTIFGIGVCWLTLRSGTFFPVFAALAYGWLMYLTASAIAYLQERAERMRTSSMFKRFLDPRIVTQLIDNKAIDFRNSAQSKHITVLFSDIRGFTALSEVSRAEDVVAMLNSYFSEQVKVIFNHGGTLDKFIGDAIMAFWGAPVEEPDSARRAVDAAIAMSHALESLRGRIGDIGKDLEIGIGIHTGRAVVGFIGSSDRLDYTVIGDTVNLASRVEGLTKGIGRILVTQETRDEVGDYYDWRDCGWHAVKGRERDVHLFEPIPKHVT